MVPAASDIPTRPRKAPRRPSLMAERSPRPLALPGARGPLVAALALLSAGLAWPAAGEPPGRKPPDAASAEGWWSLGPARNPPRPDVPAAHADWPRNPIARFVLARLLEKGLAPAPPADRRTLLRRVTFDLIGLPPTPEELDAFVRDPAP